MTTDPSQQPEFDPFRKRFAEIVEKFDDTTPSTPDLENPTPDDIKQNERELLAHSGVIQLGELPPEAKVAFEFSPTSRSGYNFINLKLLGWPDEDGLHTGQSILAYVDAPVIPGISRSRYIIIHGASVYPEFPERSHLGQVRENCEVVVTPLRLAAVSQLTDDMRHGLWHDAESRERHITERNIAPLFLPRVTAVNYLDPDTRMVSQCPWQRPGALES